VQEVLLQKLVQDKTNGKILSTTKESSEDKSFTFSIGTKGILFTKNVAIDSVDTASQVNIKVAKNKETTTQFVFATGVNNVIQDHNLNTLNTSGYKFWQSHFYEIGMSGKTRLTKEASQMYFKYGVSFLWNNLRLDENKYHVKNENITSIEAFPSQLSESRLRHVQMNFPVHLEWDFSKNKKDEDGLVIDGANSSVRLGIGGFVGFKLGTRQYLEYKDEANIKIAEVQYNNFNMNTVNYGLSAYVGYKATSLYVKYDLNPLFTETEIRNVSMGIRFDLN
jgi:hypothetical protein